MTITYNIKQNNALYDVTDIHLGYANHEVSSDMILFSFYYSVLTVNLIYSMQILIKGHIFAQELQQRPLKLQHLQADLEKYFNHSTTKWPSLFTTHFTHSLPPQEYIKEWIFNANRATNSCCRLAESSMHGWECESAAKRESVVVTGGIWQSKT